VCLAFLADSIQASRFSLSLFSLTTHTHTQELRAVCTYRRAEREREAEAEGTLTFRGLSAKKKNAGATGYVMMACFLVSSHINNNNNNQDLKESAAPVPRGVSYMMLACFVVVFVVHVAGATTT
jgi:hypothetical protein